MLADSETGSIRAMPRFHHLRRRSPLHVGLGATCCVLLGSGVLALASDSVTSQGNHVSSSDYTEVAPADLELGIGPFTGNADTHCVDVTYDTEAVGPMAISGVLDPNDNEFGYSAVLQSDVYCLRNSGSSAIDVSLVFANVRESELGCDAGELEAEGEDCEATGELGALGEVSVGGRGPTDGGGACAFLAEHPLFTSGRWFRDFVEGSPEPPPTLLLQPGEVCPLVFTFLVGTDPETAVLVQTDEVQFDVVFAGTVAP